jgi:hypothetical protein
MLGAAALGACADLPAISANSCGNGVIEPGEDCDGFPVYSVKCREKGQIGACHLDCSGDEDGANGACPQGWGCDLNAICRAPSGNFTSPETHNIGATADLLAGDFDGDGRADIVSKSPPDRLVRSRLSFHFLDAQGRVEETREFAKPVSPWLGDLSGDGRADLVFSDTNVGLLLGRDDRRIVLETFSSYRIPDTRLRLTGVYDGDVSGALSLVAFGTFAGKPAFSVPDLLHFSLRTVGELDSPIDGRTVPVPGNLIEGVGSPCDEIVLAVPETSAFWLLDLCEPTQSDGQVVWREAALQYVIPLQPAAQLDGRALIADLNADHHLDVLLGTRDAQGVEHAYVAYGDGQSLRDAEPFTQAYSDNGAAVSDQRLPLAVGDFSGDGWADFVYANHLVDSTPTPMAGPPRYQVVSGNIGEPWTAAAVADINDNGKNDVIVASEYAVGVDVFNGTGGPFLYPTSLPSEQPIAFLNVGDFDGDLINDIVFAEQPVASDDRASLSIAFGEAGHLPAEPRLVGRVQNLEQLSGYRQAARGHILLASVHGEPVNYSGIITLEGTQDRLPFAPYMLVTFSEDGNFMNFPALHVLGGSFRGPDHRDVIALDTDAFTVAKDQPISNRFWLFNDIAEGEQPPAPLGGAALDPTLVPEWIEEGRRGSMSADQLLIASCAADLDGDQRDEAVWAMPTATGACGISSIAVSSDDPPKAIARGTLVLEQHCERPALLSFDANQDGAPDLLLSSARSDAAGELARSLWVLWNDCHGGFAADQMDRLSDAEDAPLDFTTLPAVTVPGIGAIAPSVVYITEHGLARKSWSERAQRFERVPQVPSLALAAGRALTSADFNGDGAVDLALADGNKLMVFLAELEAP